MIIFVKGLNVWSLFSWCLKTKRLSQIGRGFNSEVRQMNDPWRIPDLVFSFPGIFLDGYWVFPSPTRLADPRYGWIEFFSGSIVWWVHWCFHWVPFPWGIRICEEKMSIQIFSNEFMLGKFFSIIRSEGVHFFFDRIQ